MIIPARGRVYYADLGYGIKPFLVVSNNQRNRQLQDVLAVRLTTSVKPEMPSIVILGDTEPFTGRVLCDGIVSIYRDEFKEDVGALSRAAMEAVGGALAHALSLR